MSYRVQFHPRPASRGRAVRKHGRAARAIALASAATVVASGLLSPPAVAGEGPPGIPCELPSICCELACSIEPFCCDAPWTLVCTELAAEICGGLFSCPPNHQIELVTLRSGQVNGAPGLPGQPDSQIRFDSSAAPGCDPNSLDLGAGLPFAPAILGPPARIINPVGVWAPNLPSDPLARWINWSASPPPGSIGSPSHSTLYAHPFTISSPAPQGALVTLTWAVDDYLGDPAGGPAPIGGYVNGHPLPLLTGGNYAVPTTMSATVPASALMQGTNHLFLYQRDLGCAVSGLIYSATIEVCVPPPVPSCVTPPKNMRGWWPFDEPFGLVADDLTQFSNNGQHQPAASGPTPVPGMVAGALAFDGIDDVVVVPPTPALDVSCGAFSVDLWMKRAAPSAGSGLETLVSHYFSNGGWIFGVDTVSGQLILVLEGSSLRCVPTSTATVPVGVWTHVAVTVSPCCGPNQRQVTFYINGAAAGSMASSCCDLTSLGGPASIAMGGAVWISNAYKGILDEVEYFCRLLNPSEIAALHAAGPLGKCKDSCHASWDRQLCLNFGFDTQIDATIVNNSTAGSSYSWSITPSGNCPLTGFTYTPSSGTVFVPPGGSATILSTAIAPGPFSIGNACFDVTFTNLSTGISCTTMGMILSEICGCWVEPDIGVVEIGLNEQASGAFRATAGSDGFVLDYMIVAMPSDMVSTDTVVSLNGLPPGEPVLGSIAIEPNQTVVIGVPLAYLACGAIFDWTDVILYGTTLDGTMKPLASFGVQMVAALSCLGDLNDDGVVNGSDLGILLSGWGSAGPGDINGDGTVNGADLGLLLGAWGPCP
jgi:hypothetical protein